MDQAMAEPAVRHLSAGGIAVPYTIVVHRGGAELRSVSNRASRYPRFVRRLPLRFVLRPECRCSFRDLPHGKDSRTPAADEMGYPRHHDRRSSVLRPPVAAAPVGRGTGNLYQFRDSASRSPTDLIRICDPSLPVDG